MIESSNGAKASAILYRLVETTKANMANTFEYFNLLLTESPRHMDDKDLRFIDDLLPWSPRVPKNAQADTKNLDFQCAYPFCKICSIPAKMWEFLIPITHVWGFTLSFSGMVAQKVPEQSIWSYKFAGEWKDSRSAESIIEDIRNSRTSNREIELWYEEIPFGYEYLCFSVPS